MTETIVVCAECLQASCWHGVFMCDRSRTADIVEMPIERLREMALEHPENWDICETHCVSRHGLGGCECPD